MLLTGVLCLFSCDPPSPDSNILNWYVKNCTQENVSISWTTRENVKNYVHLSPGDSVRFAVGSVYTEPSAKNDIDWLKGALAEDKIEVLLYSKTDQLIRTWYYDSRYSAGHQLFNEQYNKLYNNPPLGKDTVFSYVFEILPDDLKYDEKLSQ